MEIQLFPNKKNTDIIILWIKVKKFLKLNKNNNSNEN